MSPVSPFFFLPLIFSGTASGYFLRPAASRLLLSRFRPKNVGFPPIKQPLALEAEATRFCVPQENGARKRRIKNVLLSNPRRICWSRPGAASTEEQRFKIHRSFRRHTTLLEKRGRRMGLESRVASHRDFPPSLSRIRSQHHQERRSRSGRRQPHQLDLRAGERH